MKFNKKNIKKELQENRIPFEENFDVNGIKYDFKIGDTLLDIVPFSESCFDEKNGTLKDKKRYIEISNNLTDTDYECIHWYEHYDHKKMVDFLRSKSDEITKVLYGRKLKVAQVDPKIARDFVNENHLLNLPKKSTFNAGLYDGDELVSVMAFSKVKNTKTNQKIFGETNLDNCWELIRFCTKTGYSVVGGAAKLFKYFVKENNPDGVLTYSDYNLGKGNVYKKLGFEIAKKPGVNCFWSHPKDTELFINDNLVRCGTDRIIPKYEKEFGFKYFPLGMDYNKFVTNGGKKLWDPWWKEHKGEPMSAKNWPGNIDNMRFYGFVRIFDCGYTTFLWKKPE